MLKPALKEDYLVRAPTMDDLEAATALVIAAETAEMGRAEVTLEELRIDWESPDFKLETNAVLIVAPDGQPVAYTNIWDKPSPVTLWSNVNLPPQPNFDEVGEVLMAWIERRAREMARGVEPGVRVAVRCGANSTYEPIKRVYENAGFICIRHSYRMGIDLDVPPLLPEWPEGITMRTAIMGQDERAVLQAQRDSFQDHFGYVEMPFEEDFEGWLRYWQSDPEFDPSLWFLAMDGDTIAGISLCKPSLTGYPEMGWVGTLGVTRPYRRMGVGMALLRHSFHEFYKRGKKQVGLGVDASNLTGAVRLYEQAGMRSLVRFDLYEKEVRTGRDITRQHLDRD